jgi:hypothetical protein
MVTVHDIGAHAEQQECAGTICAFGFALSKALVTDERTLLVANETTKRHALEGPVRQISVHLARRDETRQNRCTYVENFRWIGSHLSVRMLSKRGPQCIARFANMLTGAHATKQILSSLSMTGARGAQREQGGSRLTYAIQGSTVPNVRSSASCALRTTSQLSTIHRSLITEKYV